MPVSKIIRNIFLLGVLALLFFSLTLVGAYLYFASSLPRVDTLEDYRPPVITTVYSRDGQMIGEYFRERRIIVPVSKIPKQLIQAFVAAEDSNFFKHRGLDLPSIFRAALKNIKAGGIVQGGSTITQQVAKSLLLSPEKTFTRKFKEAILAWRIENQLSKEEILYLYLNQIYLGHAAYGVEAASETYFAKNVEELSLAECALLAGLPQAPSRYSPYRRFDRAKERQKYVLRRMLKEGFITPREAESAEAENLSIHSKKNQGRYLAPYFSEQVRRYLETTYGEDRLYNEGLQIYTTLDLAMHEAAQLAVQENLRNYDKRQGFRGPEKILAVDEEIAFLEEQAAAFENSPPREGDILKGVVRGHDGNELLVRFGSFDGILPPKNYQWAGTIRVGKRGNAFRSDPSNKNFELPVGSLISIAIEKKNGDGSFLLGLEQHPEAQSCLVALDPRSGEIRAMVGGFDFAESQFNRVLQALRQPGSAIKPIIYAAALDKGYTPATIILDTPVIYKEQKASGEEVVWKPKNYSERFTGATSLRKALTHSYNVVTIKILQDIGVNYAANYATKLGVGSAIAKDLTLALGSSPLTPMELATVFSVFANGGVQIAPRYITKILDRNGRLLESSDPADFPDGPQKDQYLIPQSRERVLSPETAYLITNLMESVVRNGTGWRAKALGRPVAGKTGTTNNLKDAWFAGYIPELVSVVWVGHDKNQPLGRKETGSRAAAPAWVAFMKEAVKDIPVHDFSVPDAIDFRPIDPQTGLLAPEEAQLQNIEAFAPGTAPKRYALESQKLHARDFFKIDLEGN